MKDKTQKKASQASVEPNLKTDEKAAELRRTLEEKKKEAKIHSQDIGLKDQFRQF